MKLILVTLAAALLSLAGASPDQPARPKITGIDHVRLYVSSVDKSRAFYGDVLGLPSSGGGCSGVVGPCFPVNWYQQVELEKVPTLAPQNWLAEIAFATDDVTGMRRYLLAHGVATGAVSKDGGAPPHFELRDPEGTPIAFVQRPAALADYEISSRQISSRMFHAGFVVKDLAKENHFYVDLLGFRL
jgi:hypothetical protein